MSDERGIEPYFDPEPKSPSDEWISERAVPGVSWCTEADFGVLCDAARDRIRLEAAWTTADAERLELQAENERLEQQVERLKEEVKQLQGKLTFHKKAKRGLAKYCGTLQVERDTARRELAIEGITSAGHLENITALSGNLDKLWSKFSQEQGEVSRLRGALARARQIAINAHAKYGDVDLSKLLMLLDEALAAEPAIPQAPTTICAALRCVYQVKPGQTLCRLHLAAERAKDEPASAEPQESEPCGTCEGTGRAPATGNFRGFYPCPDCQPAEKS